MFQKTNENRAPSKKSTRHVQRFYAISKNQRNSYCSNFVLGCNGNPPPESTRHILNSHVCLLCKFNLFKQRMFSKSGPYCQIESPDSASRPCFGLKYRLVTGLNIHFVRLETLGNSRCWQLVLTTLVARSEALLEWRLLIMSDPACGHPDFRSANENVHSSFSQKLWGQSTLLPESSLRKPGVIVTSSIAGFTVVSLWRTVLLLGALTLSVRLDISMADAAVKRSGCSQQKPIQIRSPRHANSASGIERTSIGRRGLEICSC